jgi:hypothetical protein
MNRGWVQLGELAALSLALPTPKYVLNPCACASLHLAIKNRKSSSSGIARIVNLAKEDLLFPEAPADVEILL